MTWASIASTTGVNLEDVEALRRSVAETVTVELDGTKALREAVMETARRGLTMPPVNQAQALLSQVAAVAAALGSVEAALAADAARSTEVNRGRLLRRRDEFLAETWRPGAWTTRVKVEGPRDPDLVRPYGNRKLTEAEVTAKWLGQFKPSSVVFGAARGSGRRDVMWPIYPTDTAGLAKDLPDARHRFWYFGAERMVMQDLPGLGPSRVSGDCNEGVACVAADLPSRLRWAKWGCLPIDIRSGCTPWTPSWAFFSLGTWPCWGGLGQRWPVGPQGLTIATLLHSPSALHLAVPADTVRAALLATITRCNITSLQVDPGQGGSGVYRQGVRLVLRGPVAQGWSPAAALVAGQPVAPLVAGPDLAVMIDRMCDWLALRHAMLAALQERLPLPPELVTAARAAPDPEVRAAAEGRWSSTGFHVDDPLGVFVEEPASQAAGSGGLRRPGGAANGVKTAYWAAADVKPASKGVAAAAFLGAVTLGSVYWAGRRR